MNEIHTVQMCHSTYLLALELDGIAWREADAVAESGNYHFEKAIAEAFDQADEEQNARERAEIEEDDYFDDSMDGDHESALASVYGDNDDFGGGSDFDDF